MTISLPGVLDTLIALEPNRDINSEPELVSVEEVTLESDLTSPDDGDGSPRDGPTWSMPPTPTPTSTSSACMAGYS